MQGGGERDQAGCAKRGVQGSNQAGGGGRALPRCPALVNLLICIGIGRPHLDDDMISAIIDRELEVGVLLFSRLDDPHDAHLVQVAPIDRETLLAVRMLVCILQLLDRDWDERRLVPASTGLQDEWGGRVNAGLKKSSARWAVLGHVGLLEEGIFTCVTHLSVGTTVVDLEASALAVLERGTAKALPHHKRTNREGHRLYLHGAAARKQCRGDSGWGGAQVPWEC